MRSLPSSVMCLALLLAGGPAASRPPGQDLEKQVADSERAFAATMAARDFAGFGKFVAEEAVFFSDAVPLRGRKAIMAAWKKYYEGREAPKGGWKVVFDRGEPVCECSK